MFEVQDIDFETHPDYQRYILNIWELHMRGIWQKVLSSERRHLDSYTLWVKSGSSNKEVMYHGNVFGRSIIQLDIEWSHDGCQSEVHLSIGKASSRQQCFPYLQGRTYFIPKHCLLPLPKLTRYFFSRAWLNSPALVIHLSGRNSCGLGKIAGLMRMKYAVELTGVYDRISDWIQVFSDAYQERNLPLFVSQDFFRGYSGQSCCDTVWQAEGFSYDSWLVSSALILWLFGVLSTRYGSCDSFDHVSTSGACLNSSFNFHNVSLCCKR